jgi:hypothetical protein
MLNDLAEISSVDRYHLSSAPSADTLTGHSPLSCRYIHEIPLSILELGTLKIFFIRAPVFSQQCKGHSPTTFSATGKIFQLFDLEYFRWNLEKKLFSPTLGVHLYQLVRNYFLHFFLIFHKFWCFLKTSATPVIFMLSTQFKKGNTRTDAYYAGWNTPTSGGAYFIFFFGQNFLPPPKIFFLRFLHCDFIHFLREHVYCIPSHVQKV